MLGQNEVYVLAKMLNCHGFKRDFLKIKIVVELITI